MANTHMYTIRPPSKPPRADLKDVFRVYLSPTTIQAHRLRPGDACVIQTCKGQTGHAIAWTSAEKNPQDAVIQISKVFQELHDFKVGDRVSIHHCDPFIETVKTIFLSGTSHGEQAELNNIDEAQRTIWEAIVDDPLKKAEILCVGMKFEAIEFKEQKRSFRVQNINSSSGSDRLYRFVSTSKIEVKFDLKSNIDRLPDTCRSLKIDREEIGGLTKQLGQLDGILAEYGDLKFRLKLPAKYRPSSSGVLLYGPPGTGKTLLLNSITAAPWCKVYHIDRKIINATGINSEVPIKTVFSDAHGHQPSVVILDRLELIAGKTDNYEVPRATNVAPILREAMDGVRGSHIFVIAATTNLSNIDEDLRHPGYLDTAIEVPIPDWRARAEILRVLSGLSKGAKANELDDLGDRTHGFVGADLDKLIQLAMRKAKERVLAKLEVRYESLVQGSGDRFDSVPFDKLEEISVEVTEVDLNNAFLEVRPTAMQEVFLETPKVRWSDIGGQHEIKKSLRQAVEWPFKKASRMSSKSLRPKKGLLLYGPPGCSKTLTAKALATEADLNFIAVKGAELLSMYVGESERAVREVFRKARAASPSIIFFDEIDAIGASRDGAGQNSSLNVLTTLLNELDGIEVLKGVFVLAATNKPEVLDPALMRPGRLDTALYVGPPNLESRREILQICVSNMELAGDVDLTWLAEVTDGYSGAELDSICQRAGYASMEEEERTGEEILICKRDFELALTEVRRQITPEMIARHEKWGARD